ncbi:hypothetical protein MNV49_003415 [Pseudohyphozyma bogoriensis]|nr:hypothetical protein MNV49_003415 [Pseudohyphozyma bogoriensis]
MDPSTKASSSSLQRGPSGPYGPQPNTLDKKKDPAAANKSTKGSDPSRIFNGAMKASTSSRLNEVGRFRKKANGVVEENPRSSLGMTRSTSQEGHVTPGVKSKPRRPSSSDEEGPTRIELKGKGKMKVVEEVTIDDSEEEGDAEQGDDDEIGVFTDDEQRQRPNPTPAIPPRKSKGGAGQKPRKSSPDLDLLSGSPAGTMYMLPNDAIRDANGIAMGNTKAKVEKYEPMKKNAADRMLGKRKTTVVAGSVPTDMFYDTNRPGGTKDQEKARKKVESKSDKPFIMNGVKLHYFALGGFKHYPIGQSSHEEFFINFHFNSKNPDNDKIWLRSNGCRTDEESLVVLQPSFFERLQMTSFGPPSADGGGEDALVTFKFQPNAHDVQDPVELHMMLDKEVPKKDTERLWTALSNWRLKMTVGKLSKGVVLHYEQGLQAALEELERNPRPSRKNDQRRANGGDDSSGPSYQSTLAVLVWPHEGIGAVSVTHGDRKRLLPEEFLNDTLIELGMKRISDRMERQDPEAAKSIHMFNSFFYKKLGAPKPRTTPVGEHDTYPSVKKWTTKIKLFEKKYIVVPINEHLHWYLAIIINPAAILAPPPTEAVAKRTRLSTAADEISPHFRNPDAEPDETEPMDLDSGDDADAQTNDIKIEQAFQAELEKKEGRAAVEDVEMEGLDRKDVALKGSPDVDGDVDMRDLPGAPAPKEITTGSAGLDALRDYAGSESSSAEDSDAAVAQALGTQKSAPSKSPPAVPAPAPNPFAFPKPVTFGPSNTPPGPRTPEPEPAPSNVEHVNVGSDGDDDGDDIFAKVRKYADPTKCYIITFDSLGGTHGAVHKRLSQYLAREADDKEHIANTSEEANVVRIVAKVPQQNNFCDCGLYLLHYLNRFFSAPDRMLDVLINQNLPPKASRAEKQEAERISKEAWDPDTASKAREVMKEEVDQMCVEWAKYREPHEKQEEMDRKLKKEQRAKDKQEKEAIEAALLAQAQEEEQKQERKDKENRQGKEKEVDMVEATPVVEEQSKEKELSPPPANQEAAKKGGKGGRGRKSKAPSSPEVITLDSDDSDDDSSPVRQPPPKAPLVPTTTKSASPAAPRAAAMAKSKAKAQPIPASPPPTRDIPRPQKAAAKEAKGNVAQEDEDVVIASHVKETKDWQPPKQSQDHSPVSRRGKKPSQFTNGGGGVGEQMHSGVDVAVEAVPPRRRTRASDVAQEQDESSEGPASKKRKVDKGKEKEKVGSDDDDSLVFTEVNKRSGTQSSDLHIQEGSSTRKGATTTRSHADAGGLEGSVRSGASTPDPGSPDKSKRAKLQATEKKRESRGGSESSPAKAGTPGGVVEPAVVQLSFDTITLD